MCERYVLPRQEDAEREFVPAHRWWKFTPSFNVSFPQYVPVLRRHDGAVEGVMMRWGLVPASAEAEPLADEKPDLPFEWVGQTPDTRDAWLNSQRCILPMSGFYLWHLTDRRYRQPYFVSVTDRSVFGVAALWERSEGGDDDVIESFTIITVPANPLVARLDRSGGRMPAILRRKDYPTWLSGTPVQAKAVLHAYPDTWMRAYPVSPKVNSPRNDDASLIRPIA
jgi:putative SOS response-associated peptidase YedK